jgi:hypothetical protein
MYKCLNFKFNWNNCSNQILIKYNELSDEEYYKEMNYCFEFYKKYKECLLQIRK